MGEKASKSLGRNSCSIIRLYFSRLTEGLTSDCFLNFKFAAISSPNFDSLTPYFVAEIPSISSPNGSNIDQIVEVTKVG